MQHRKRARRWWLFSHPRCTCGLPWPCIEAWMEESRQHEERRTQTSVSDPPPSAPAWNANTKPLFQVGRAGALTPAQERRARGGSSW